MLYILCRVQNQRSRSIVPVLLKMAQLIRHFFPGFSVTGKNIHDNLLAPRLIAGLRLVNQLSIEPNLDSIIASGTYIACFLLHGGNAEVIEP